jgi:hypothetical protein
VPIEILGMVGTWDWGREFVPLLRAQADPEAS